MFRKGGVRVPGKGRADGEEAEPWRSDETVLRQRDECDEVVTRVSRRRGLTLRGGHASL